MRVHAAVPEETAMLSSSAALFNISIKIDRISMGRRHRQEQKTWCFKRRQSNRLIVKYYGYNGIDNTIIIIIASQAKISPFVS